MMAKLTLRSLAAHRLRLVFTTLAVTLGVSFVAGTMIFSDTSARSFDPIFTRMAQLADVMVQAKQPFAEEDAPPRRVPDSVLSTLERKVPGASSFHGAMDGYAAIVKPDGQVVGGENAGHDGMAFIDRAGSKVKMISGRPPVAADDVVVESRTAEDGGIKVGDSVDVQTLYETRKMRVVGIFDLDLQGFDGIVTFIAFTPDTAQTILTGIEPGKGPKQYSSIWLRVRPGVSQKQLVAQVTAALPPDYEVKTGEDLAAEQKAEIRELFDLLGRVLLAFAAISVLVGSFIIFNTFTMLLAQRTRELALLRAVGASRAQVTRAVLGEAIGIGFLGSTIGLLAGVGVFYGLRLLVARFGAQLPPSAPVIELRTVLWSYSVGVVVTVLAAYLPARRAAKIPPVAALRDDVALQGRSMRLRLIGGTFLAVVGALAVAAGLSEGGQVAGFLASIGSVAMFVAMFMLSPVLSRPVIKVLGWPIAWLAGATGRLSRENARRDPRRSAATASALMVGLALVSMASVLADSTNASADRRLDREFGAEYSMEPRGLAGFSPDAVDRVAAVPGVRSVTPVQVGTLKIANDEVSIVVADPAGLTVPASLNVESGTGVLGPNELLVQQTLAKQRGWQVGSTVTGQYPDRSTTTLRVAGIFKDNQVVNKPYIMSPASYRPHATGNLVQKAFIDLDDRSLKSARDGVQSALRAYPNVQLKDRQAAKAGARGDIDQLLNVIMALLALSIVIAAVGIVNTLGLSVIERTREIGLLRAVGMGRRQVRSMIRYESVIIATFGAALGVSLGVGIGWAMQRSMSTAGIEVLSIPTGRLGLYLLIAVLIGVIAAIWPAWRAARMNILQAIHHQ